MDKKNARHGPPPHLIVAFTLSLRAQRKKESMEADIKGFGVQHLGNGASSHMRKK